MVVATAYSDNLLGNIGSVAATARISTGDESIGFTHLHHHHAEIVAVEHLLKSLRVGESVALKLLREVLCIAAATVGLTVVAKVYNLHILQLQAKTLSTLLNHFFVTKQNRLADAFVAGHNCSLEHIVGVCLSKYHTLRVAFCLLGESAHELIVVAHKLLQFLLVSLPVGDWSLCHTRFHCATSYSGRYGSDKAWVESLRQYVFRAESHLSHVVSCVHDWWHRLLCKVGNSMHGSKLHLLIDCSSATIESTTEDIWESKHIVYLVRIVGASGSKNNVGARSNRLAVFNLGIRICKSKHNRLLCHRLNHFGSNYIFNRKTEEHISSYHCLSKSVNVTVGSKFQFLRIEVGAFFVDNALAVAHHHILLSDTESDVEARTRHCGSTGAVNHKTSVFNLLALYFKRIEKSGSRNYCGAVLVVVHHRNVTFLLQSAFNLKALRRLDILKVNTSESRGD